MNESDSNSRLRALVDSQIQLWLVQSGWSECSPGHSYGPAVRDHYLVHYVKQGQGIFEKNGKEYSVGPGECFFIFPGEVTRYTASETNPWNYYWVGFDGDMAKALLARTTITKNNPVFVLEEESFSVESCVKELFAYSEGQFDHPLRASGLLLQFLSYLVESVPRLSEKNYSVERREYLTKAMYYVQENYSKEMSVQKMADYIGINRSYLYRIFVDYFHISPSSYITAFRIEECCKLLRESNFTVSEIAMNTGFSSASHMGKEFKKIKKMSPSKYRSMFGQTAD